MPDTSELNKWVSDRANEAFSEVIGRALLDIDFRKAIVADPDASLSGYEITSKQKEILKNTFSDPNIENVKVSDLADAFGARWAGFGGGAVA